MVLEWHVFLRLSWGFVSKMLSFVGKHLSFYPEDVVLFIFCFFYLNEKEFNRRSNKICRKWNFQLYHSQKKSGEREKSKKHNPTSKRFLKLLKKFSLVTLVTNYHKLSLLPLFVRPWRKIGVKFWILLLFLQTSYIFLASAKDLNVLQLNFCH